MNMHYLKSHENQQLKEIFFKFLIQSAPVLRPVNTIFKMEINLQPIRLCTSTELYAVLQFRKSTAPCCLAATTKRNWYAKTTSEIVQI